MVVEATQTHTHLHRHTPPNSIMQLVSVARSVWVASRSDTWWHPPSPLQTHTYICTRSARTPTSVSYPHTPQSTHKTVILCSMSPPCLVTFPSCLPHCRPLFLFCAPPLLSSSTPPSLHPINTCWHFLPQLRKKQLKVIDRRSVHGRARTHTRTGAHLQARDTHLQTHVWPWICKWVFLTFKDWGGSQVTSFFMGLSLDTTVAFSNTYILSLWKHTLTHLLIVTDTQT